MGNNSGSIPQQSTIRQVRHVYSSNNHGIIPYGSSEISDSSDKCEDKYVRGPKSLNEDDRNLVFGYIRIYIQYELELKAKQTNYQYQLIIPESINYLCLQFVGSALFSSSILSIPERECLIDALQPKLITNHLKCLYRASIDGFESKQFHHLCDHKAPLIVVVQSDNNAVFGGYTSKPYGGSNRFISDNDSFLFLLRNGNNVPERSMNNENIICFPVMFARCAIQNAETNGPTFGTGDLTIYDKCNESAKNICELGEAYKQVGNVKYLAGSKRFRVIDYEIFTVINSRSESTRYSLRNFMLNLSD